MSTNPGAELARFVAELTYESIPSQVQQRVKEILVDAVASAVAGRRGDETALIERMARVVGGEGTSTVLAGPRLSAGGAALLNGYQVTAVTVCDTYRPALCHVTPEVLPPALAVGEDRRVSGRRLLTAVAAGLEVTTRLGGAINYEAFRQRGWHSPGVIGPFGGAAAVGSLLGLDATAQRHAFGLAGSQAAGTFAHWGTPTIKFHQSRGSLSGLMAGLLAAEGFLSAEDVLANPDGGIFVSYSDGGRPDDVVADLGERWELTTIGLRRWPAASSVQTMLTGLFTLIDEHDLRPDDVERVVVRLSPTVYRMHGALPWTSTFSAQLSAPYLVSVVLHDRQCWLDQFSPERYQDPQVDTFASQRVEMREDDALGGTASTIEVRLRGGTTVTDARTLPKGDPADPLSMDEIVDKLAEAAKGQLSPDAVARATDLLLDLENLDDVSEAVRCLGADPQP